jgi:hypothetical protein
MWKLVYFGKEYDISVKSLSDNLTVGINVKSVSDNLTEGTIPLQKDSKTDQTTSEDMETPTATPFSDEGPWMCRRKKQTPINQKWRFFMVNSNVNLDSNSFTIYHQNICGLKGKNRWTYQFYVSKLPPHLMSFWTSS